MVRFSNPTAGKQEGWDQTQTLRPKKPPKQTKPKTNNPCQKKPQNKTQKNQKWNRQTPAVKYILLPHWKVLFSNMQKTFSILLEDTQLLLKNCV